MRGALEAVPVGVLADRDEDLPDRLLDAGEVNGVLDRGTGELAVDQPGGEIVQLVRLGRAAVRSQRLPS
jgi:hypothetical protein